MRKCVICRKDAIFKIKNQEIYYCKEHAQEFFSIDCLENVGKLEKGAKQAKVLQKYLKK